MNSVNSALVPLRLERESIHPMRQAAWGPQWIDVTCLEIRQNGRSVSAVTVAVAGNRDG